MTDVFGIPVSLLKDLGLAGAAATVVSALITGIVSVYLKRRSDEAVERVKSDLKTFSDTTIEKLRAELQYENKVRSARVDYEYEARKRLYKEVEPIIFVAHLAAASVRARVIAFVDRIQSQDICQDKSRNWLAIDPYFLQSTAYRIFLPMTYYNILSKQISQYDFVLEPVIGRKFMALAVFDDIPTGDFDLAGMFEPALPYRPYADVSDKEKKDDVAQYTFQGIVRGDVQRFIAAMTSTEEGRRGPIEWFQFEQQLAKARSPLSRAFGPVRNTLFNFHPATHPVVWRALVAYVLLADFFLEASDFTIEEFDQRTASFGWKKFDFRTEEDDLDEAGVQMHFEAARLFVRSRLTERFRTLDAASRRDAAVRS